MYIAVTGSKNNKDVYIYQSFRKKDGSYYSAFIREAWKHNTSLEQFDGDNEKLMAWAWSQVCPKNLNSTMSVRKRLKSSSRLYSLSYQARSFMPVIYFLQLCTELRLDNICRVIKGHHKFKYDLHAILTDLVYWRWSLLQASSAVITFAMPWTTKDEIHVSHRVFI